MRKTSIDFFRYFFMLNICLWHLNDQLHLLSHGYLAVEFFFIVSGFFLFKKKEGRLKEMTTMQFLIARYKRFYPKYIFAFFITAILKWKMFVPENLGGADFWFDSLFSRIFEVFLIQATGFSESGEHVINGPMWFLSSLIWSSAFVYATQRTFKRKATSYILPIFIFVGYTYLLNNPAYWNIEVHNPEVVFVYSRMIRGICGVSFGYMAAYLYYTYRIERIPTPLIDGISIFAFGVLILAEFANNAYDNYALLTIPCIIINCFIPNSVFNRIIKSKIFISLGKVSFDMFLIHIAFLVIFRYFLRIYDLPVSYIIIIYLIGVTASGYLFNSCYNICCKLIRTMCLKKFSNESTVV